MGVSVVRELGEHLRQARLERGITLEQIQNSSKIRLRYLQALEAGSFSAIPGEVYLRGFLQNYASCVGLDPHAILELYDRMRTAKETPVEKPAEPPATSTRQRTWREPALLGAGIVLVGLLILLVVRSGIPRPEQRRAPKKSVDTGRDPAPAARRQGGVNLVLQYTARCWVSIRCDGRLVFEGTVDAGAIQEWTAQEVILGQFGNSGGVRAELNGKRLEPLGITGESARKEFRANPGTS